MPRLTALCVLALAAGMQSLKAQPAYVWPMPGLHRLSGTYGELRPGSLHAGIDIRTNERTGYAVVAVADGYVYRLMCSYTSYGRAVYLRHTDGYESVYGHLERFHPRLEKRLRQAQDNSRQFNQHLYFTPGEFSFRKGDTLGYSGNTGLSGGPHLHFEIRDAQERPLNPLKWLSDSLEDPYPPYITRVAFQPLDAQARVQGRFEKWVKTPQSSGYITYFLPDTVFLRGQVGFEFTAFDQLRGSTPYCGIYSAELKLDGVRVYGYRMDRFSFDDGVQANQHMDMPFYHSTGGYLQKGYRDLNCRLPIYTHLENNGILHLEDDRPHSLELRVGDYHGHTTTFRCTLRRDPRPDVLQLRVQRPAKAPARQRTDRKTLVLSAPAADELSLNLYHVAYSDGTEARLLPQYADSLSSTLLLPLRPNKLPKRAAHALWSDSLQFDYLGPVYPQRSVKYALGPELSLEFPAGCVFDTAYITHRILPADQPGQLCALHTLGPADVPMAGRWKLQFDLPGVPGAGSPQATLMERKPDGKPNHPLATGPLRASPNRLGTYHVVLDTLPPSFKARKFRDGDTLKLEPRLRVEFDLRDDASEVDGQQVNAWVNDRWVPLEYYWYNEWAYVWLDDQPAGPCRLRVQARDHAGNVRSETFNLYLKP